MNLGAPSGHYPLYRGRFRRELRLAAIVGVGIVVVLDAFPGRHGRSAAILVALAVAVLAEGAAVVVPSRAPLVRNVAAAVGAGVLAGVDPGATAAFLLLAGLDAAAALSVELGGTVVALCVLVTFTVTIAASNPPAEALYGLFAVGGYLLGSTIRQYVLRADEAELRLADLERAEIERSRAIQLAERTNAAREIHDILAHSLGALVVELDTANALLDGPRADLDVIRPLLRRAHEHAVDGLVEAREAVRSLRAEREAEPVEAALRHLAATSRAFFSVVGAPRPVPADVAVVLRRTAQEALANATKHAPGSSPAVRLEFLSGSVALLVTDAGPRPGAPPWPAAAAGDGFGLEGMRERARLIGAALEAGPFNGGWRVALSVPDRVGEPSSTAPAR